MTKSKLAIAFAAVTAMFAASSMVAYAHSADECLTEETFKCLDDEDFWECYDFIVDQCPSHDLPHAPANLNKLKIKVVPQIDSLVEPGEPSRAPRR